MNVDLLARLCETPGIPGREERVRALIETEVAGLFDSVETDPMGSLICRRKPRGPGNKAISVTDPTVVMLLCHMDEIGFYVTHIDENGFLWVNAAGGFDTRNLFSRRVLVCTQHGDFRAVMNPGGKPIHIATPEDRKKVPEVSEFFIDTGMPKEEVLAKIQIGDYIVMDEPFREMGAKLVSKALDNRVACWLGIEAIRQLDKASTGHGVEIVCAFTVQEEVGLRGARTSSFAVRPHIGIGLDVTLACDTPGVPKQECVSVHGEGYALHIKDGSFISDMALVNQFQTLSRDKGIKYQRSILGAGGQDAAAAQQAASGARAVGITVGTRYIHTVTEMIDRGDLAAARDVLAAYLAQAD